MQVTLEKIDQKDIPELTLAMQRAFDDDTQKYLGKAKGGPEGYDNGEFFYKWLFAYKECEGYKILVDNCIIGGILVWMNVDKNYTWGTVFVDPDWQNRGVCTQAWRVIESLYPEARSWTLNTPGYSKKNHKVYEKLGFIKIKEVISQDHPGKSYIYRKTMPLKMK